MKNKIYFVVIICFCGISTSQDILDQPPFPENTGERYVTGVDGIIRMYINVWGHVKGPGRILINEGIDIATLLSLTGGPKKGANMKNIRIYHEYPDKYGNIVHVLDFTDFLKTGDRTNFISLHPNDTYIIKQTAWSYFIEEISTVNTLMNLINIYLNLKTLIPKF